MSKKFKTRKPKLPKFNDVPAYNVKGAPPLRIEVKKVSWGEALRFLLKLPQIIKLAKELIQFIGAVRLAMKGKVPLSVVWNEFQDVIREFEKLFGDI